MRALIVFAALVSSVTLGCDKPVDYHSAEGRYRVVFPAATAERVQQLESPVGTLTLHIVEAGIAKNWVVGYVDYPNALGVNERLDGARDGIARQSKSKVVTEIAKDLGACSGREVVLEGPKGQMRGRLFLCGQRLYEVFWGGRGSFTFNRKVTEYLDSFRIDPQP